MRSALWLVLILLAAGCASTAPGENVLPNGGFEQGNESWSWLDWSPSWLHAFEIVNGSAHAGNASLRTQLVTQINETHGIVGATHVFSWQELGNRLPREIEGWYRIDQWEHNESQGGHAYAQIVVGLQPDNVTRAAVCLDMTATPCQVAWPLAGISKVPFAISNRKFVFQPDETPRLGEWIHFKIPVADDFGRMWGKVSHFDTLTLYVEARYDFDNAQSVKPVRLDVRWDDLTVR